MNEYQGTHSPTFYGTVEAILTPDPDLFAYNCSVAEAKVSHQSTVITISVVLFAKLLEK